MKVCSVCGKQRLNLVNKPSKLMPRTNFWYCSEDVDKEPRYIIMIMLRSQPELVKPYLDNHLYAGPVIAESDIK